MFRFGDFELDPGRYELRRGGTAVKTEPRVLELLDFLIRHRDRVVPKEELLDALWPDTHVSESALTSTIRDARRALDDAPSNARWIKTVYGRGFRFIGEIGAPPVTTTAPAPTKKSIAVLPFTDLSPEKDQGYFCDGIAEELINALTRIEELRVVSRAVAFDFRNDDDVRILGEKLGVGHVLRGSVRKSIERLRITVHLVEAATGHHILSEKFDRTVGDVLVLQEEIAEHAARALLGVLSERNRTAIKSTPVRVNAYEFYLKGRTYLGQRALEQAVGMFEIAVEFDPEYAPAHAGLAHALAELYGESDGDADLLARAGAASERAVALAPRLGETRVCRAHVLALAKRYADAAAELDLAIELNPRSFDAYFRYGWMRWTEGKVAEAERMFATACAIQPRDAAAQEWLARVRSL
jgi:adenylate cyclase